MFYPKRVYTAREDVTRANMKDYERAVERTAMKWTNGDEEIRIENDVNGLFWIYYGVEKNGERFTCSASARTDTPYLLNAIRLLKKHRPGARPSCEAVSPVF